LKFSHVVSEIDLYERIDRQRDVLITILGTSPEDEVATGYLTEQFSGQWAGTAEKVDRVRLAECRRQKDDLYTHLNSGVYQWEWVGRRISHDFRNGD